jgi:hypothetical protein
VLGRERWFASVDTLTASTHCSASWWRMSAGFCLSDVAHVQFLLGEPPS